MSKTNYLRETVQKMLKRTCDRVYYVNAQKDALYPHIVFSLDNTINDDPYRDDITMTVDVWDRGTSNTVIENLCDDVETLFRNVNLPQEKILPTFYLVNRIRVLDEDKQIRHISMKVLVQNYVR